MFTAVFLGPTTNAEVVPTFHLALRVYRGFPRSYNKCRASSHIPLRTACFSNKNSVVGMATGVRISAGGLLSSTKVQTCYGAHSASYSKGTRGSSLG